MISYEEAKAIHPENQDVVGGIGTVFFKVGREYEIDVEGNIYYRINTNDIIYKIK